MNAAGLLRAFEHRPGLRQIGPGRPADDHADRQQKEDDTKKIDECAPARSRVPVKDIDPDVAAVKQRVAGTHHEQGGVEVDHPFLHRDEAHTEDVAHHHDDELEEHHKKSQPRRDATDVLVGGVDYARERG